jgi:hypothetical protein
MCAKPKDLLAVFFQLSFHCGAYCYQQLILLGFRSVLHEPLHVYVVAWVNIREAARAYEHSVFREVRESANERIRKVFLKGGRTWIPHLGKRRGVHEHELEWLL